MLLHLFDCHYCLEAFRSELCAKPGFWHRRRDPIGPESKGIKGQVQAIVVAWLSNTISQRSTASAETAAAGVCVCVRVLVYIYIHTYIHAHMHTCTLARFWGVESESDAALWHAPN